MVVLVFEKMVNMDTIVWKDFFLAQACHGSVTEILKLLCCMHQYGFRHDKVTFLALLVACYHHSVIDDDVLANSCQSGETKI